MHSAADFLHKKAADISPQLLLFITYITLLYVKVTLYKLL